jgi:hypothetical protein
MHGRLWDEPGGAAYLARLTSIGEEHVVFDQIGAWASVIGLLALGHSVMFAALSFAPASPLEALSTSLGAFLWVAIGPISTIGAVCSGYIRLHTEPWVIRASRRRWRLSAHCLAGVRFTLVSRPAQALRIQRSDGTIEIGEREDCENNMPTRICQ